MAGSIGDIGFFSLGKSKNFTTIEGGIITTNSSVYAKKFEKYLNNLAKPSLVAVSKVFLKLTLYAILIKPVGFSLITRFKDVEDIDYSYYSSPSLLSNFQAAMGLILLRQLTKLNEIRAENAQHIYQELKELKKWYILIDKKEGSVGVYPSFPVIIKDEKKREFIYEKLIESGIGTARMYPASLNKITGGIGDNRPCPNAQFISERLLALPTNPFLNQEHIKVIGMIFKDAVDIV